MKATTYTVTGRWPFPVDMLRYDEAEPVSLRDKALIEQFSDPAVSPYVPGSEDEREVTITLRSGRAPHYLGTCCADRWRSFGWRSSLDTKAQQHPQAKPARVQPQRLVLDPADLNLEPIGYQFGGTPQSVLKSWIQVGNCAMHVYAIEVRQSRRALHAVNTNFEFEVECAYRLSTSSLTTLQHEGRQYVLLMYPFAN